MACGHGAAPVAPADVLLVTFSSLRADAVGALGAGEGLTPNLDALAAEGHLATRALAPSSATRAAVASMLTGLTPWSHGAWHRDAPLSPLLPTLAQRLRESGRTTRGWWSDPECDPSSGLGRGFDRFDPLESDRLVIQELTADQPGPTFTWIQLDGPAPPFPRDGRSGLRRQLGQEGAPPDDEELERWNDPSMPLTEEDLDRLAAAYELGVAQADHRLGQMLRAFAADGRWDRSLVIVTSDHGFGLGDGPGVGSGEWVDRGRIEVPLVVKLPHGHLPLELTKRPSTRALAATVLELAGVAVPPAAGPSLLHPELLEDEVVTVAFRGNGVNRFSVVAGEHQLLATSRFAAAEPSYHDAARPSRRRDLRLWERLQEAFGASLPLAPGPPSALTLLRWTGDGTEEVTDAAAAQALLGHLRWELGSWQEHPMPPARLERLADGRPVTPSPRSGPG